MPQLLQHTHLLGIVSLWAAALVGLSRPACRRRWRWRVIVAALVLMGAMIASDAVETVHDAVDAAMKARGFYPDRAELQWVLMAVAALGAALAVGWIAYGARGTERWALLATMALAGLFILQAISLHRIDAILSHPIGPVMTVAWGWLAGATAVIAAALRDGGFGGRPRRFFTHRP